MSAMTCKSERQKLVSSIDWSPDRGFNDFFRTSRNNTNVKVEYILYTRCTIPFGNLYSYLWIFIFNRNAPKRFFNTRRFFALYPNQYNFGRACL